MAVALAALLLGTSLAPRPASAQLTPPYPDARLVPRGALRVSFEPSLENFDELFTTWSGAHRPLGADFSADSAGAHLFPTAAPAQEAVRSIIGDAAYRMSVGRMQTTLDADIRRFPLNASFGVSDRLTLVVSVPIVTTRMQVDLAVDPSAANAGLNQAAALAGNPGAMAEIQLLLAELEASAAAVEARIAAGDFGCPTSATCDAARALVARARQLKADLILLTGVSESGAPSGPLPPFAPLGTSAAGAAILSAIATLSAELQAFGAPGVTATLPLPADGLGPAEVNGILTGAEFGYEALPLAFAKRTQRLGDLELGARLGLVRQPSLRVVLVAGARLPTGMRDLPDHFTDLGTGDRQTDLMGRIEAAWEAGVVSLAATGSYTLQLADRLVRRVTPPDRPIAPLATQATVRRDLGDVVQASLFPALRLSPAFTAYASAHVLSKAADTYELADGGDPGLDAAVLGEGSAAKSLSFGGGIYYRPRPTPQHLPVEAGIDYRAAFHGEGRWTPVTRTVNFYLRVFFRVSGRNARSTEQ